VDSLNQLTQLYPNNAAYPTQTVLLDPVPESAALAYTVAGLHAVLQAGTQTVEEATQMSSIFNKLISDSVARQDLTNHSISINDHPWNNASAAASGDTAGPVHPQIHTDVRNLLSRAQSAEHKLEALYSEFASYQDWVRRTVIAQHNVVEQLQQQMQAVRQELEEFRPKTLERHSSGDFTRCRTPRRRKLQNHDTSQSHRDPRADRSSGT
jgi:hypothetical protein